MWKVIYVKSRTEKKVAALLTKEGIVNFLPLTKSKRLWSDRLKTVETPLFNGYIFVQADEKLRFEVLNLPNVVKFIQFNGTDASVDDSLICAMTKAIAEGKELWSMEENDKNVEVGENVRVLAGPFSGQFGQVVSLANKNYVRVHVAIVNQYVCVKINKNYLEVEHG